MTHPALYAEQIAAQQLSNSELIKLHQGEILVNTRSHTVCGGALDSRMYLPLTRCQVWDQVTNYPRWSTYFPDITQSRVIEENAHAPHLGHRIYQAAEKSFLFITAQVNVYLRVFELEQRHIRFQFERGSFLDFTADLTLSDLNGGTLLHYSVSATPLVPVPSFFVEQAMKLDLPNNLRSMRQKLCR
ncbi:SRPBCC family protein [Lyngbya confervoides]|uniref:SRPBCC family protein n=1 Tax=Lyngbya confervoides BDU141951 TaxID=1574623 RepID=A0ABD4T9P3_9CYAN|nr:SRPBCC family protein [Lyngbya confervoides]MCM1985214.1 SRPBCC family protein [Lyngbya confervoides BDU141951]